MTLSRESTRATGIIDTHSHLQAEVFDDSRARLLYAARSAGVENMLLCAAAPSDWERTLCVARQWGLGAMLGIHPLWVSKARPEDLLELRRLVEELLLDEHFIGIGEVGLDGLEPKDDPDSLRWEEKVFLECLKIARDFELPLSIHVRKTASKTLGLLRRVFGAPNRPGFKKVLGAVHAFNGSEVERNAFLSFGLKLGFGGAATYAGSLRIRRHLCEVPDEGWVLETDAPDMPGSARRDAFARGSAPLTTEPADIIETLRLAAELRGIASAGAERESRSNALAAFPRLAALLDGADAFAKRTAIYGGPAETQSF